MSDDDWGAGGEEACEECGQEWCTCGEIEEPEPIEPGLMKRESTMGSIKFFTLKEFRDKYFDKELSSYEDILPDNKDEMIAICRFFKWNKDKISSQWFEKMDELRLEIGLDYDTNLVKKYPEINGSLAANNGGMCSVWGEEFDENDPDMKCFELGCGH